MGTNLSRLISSTPPKGQTVLHFGTEIAEDCGERCVGSASPYRVPNHQSCPWRPLLVLLVFKSAFFPLASLIPSSYPTTTARLGRQRLLLGHGRFGCSLAISSAQAYFTVSRFLSFASAFAYIFCLFTASPLPRPNSSLMSSSRSCQCLPLSQTPAPILRPTVVPLSSSPPLEPPVPVFLLPLFLQLSLHRLLHLLILALPPNLVLF